MKIFSVVGLLAGALAACTSHKPTAPDRPGVYAYLTGAQVVVMDGTRTVASARVLHPLNPGVVWTLDGRYISVVGDDPKAPGKAGQRVLVVVDSTTGAKKQMQCPYCSGQAPVGGSIVFAASVQNAYGDDEPDALDSVLRFDLSKTEPPTRLTVKIPPPQPMHIGLIAGSSGEALVFGYEGNGKEDYYSLGQDGVVKQVGSYYPTVVYDNTGRNYLRGVYRSASIQVGSNAPIFAIIGDQKAQDNRCGARSEIMIPGVSTILRSVDVSRFMPSPDPKGRDLALLIHDLWWDGSGQLHATFEAGVCDNTSSHTTPSTEWRLVDNQWMRVSPEQVISARELPNGTKIVLLYVEGKSPSKQPLYLEKGEFRTRIADDVSKIFAPPASPADVAAHLTPDICPLGQVLCVRTATADIDGDGKMDAVGLTSTALFSKDPRGWAVLRISFANGRRVEQSVLGGDDGVVPWWIGVTDMNGDNRGDVVFMVSPTRGLSSVSVYEYQKDRLQPLRGDFGGTLSIDGSSSTITGFTCQRPAGQPARVTSVSASLVPESNPQRYEGRETTYVSDNGTMRKVGARPVSYVAGAKNLAAYAGAHCSGLEPFGSSSE